MNSFNAFPAAPAASAKFASAVRRRIEALRLALYYSPKEITKIDQIKEIISTKIGL